MEKKNLGDLKEQIEQSLPSTNDQIVSTYPYPTTRILLTGHLIIRHILPSGLP